MTHKELALVRRMYDSQKHTVDAIAETVGVSRATIYRHLAPPAEARAKPAAHDHDNVVAGAMVAAVTKAVRLRSRSW